MNDIKTIAGQIDELLGNEKLDGAETDKIVSSSKVMKGLIDQSLKATISKLVQDLFDTCDIIPIGMSYDEVAEKLISGTITMGVVLAKMKELAIAANNASPKMVSELEPEQITVQEPDVEPEINNEEQEIPVQEITDRPLPEAEPETVLEAGSWESDFRSSFSTTIKLENIDFIIDMGKKISVVLPDNEFSRFWNEIVAWLNTKSGMELTNAWGGGMEYYVASLGYAAYMKLYAKDTAYKRNKEQFYSIVDIDKPKNCFRSLSKIKDAGLTYSFGNDGGDQQ